MVLDGALADDEGPRDRHVRHAPREQADDLALARGQIPERGLGVVAAVGRSRRPAGVGGGSIMREALAHPGHRAAQLLAVVLERAVQGGALERPRQPVGVERRDLQVDVVQRPARVGVQHPGRGARQRERDDDVRGPAERLAQLARRAARARLDVDDRGVWRPATSASTSGYAQRDRERPRDGPRSFPARPRRAPRRRSAAARRRGPR